MSDTCRAMSVLAATKADMDMVGVLLGASSDAEAAIAFMLLRSTFPDQTLVLLANLREIICELPEAPFATGAGLEILTAARGYEHTSRSYRQLFESEHGIYGLEFIGQGKLCESIVVHTAASHFMLIGDEEPVVEPAVLDVLVNHRDLLDEVIESLQLLGMPMAPKIYLTCDDFLAEHAATVASEAFGEFF